MKRIVNALGKVLVLCATTAIGLTAQTFTTLHSFEITDGESPLGGLAQGADGNFYGTTYYGGASDDGTVFQITPSGTLATLHSFEGNPTDGAEPQAGLVQATNGDFYGTTRIGGAWGDGAIFKITPSGKLTMLHSFCSQAGCADGANPEAGLVQATNGDLYGTTESYGDGSGGTVFKITSSGTLTTLYAFCSKSGCTDGANPEAGLIQAADGDFYGTTFGGGADGRGTVFKMTVSGMLTTLYSYSLFGDSFQAGLVQATDGNLYGTTYDGGANGVGSVFRISPDGLLTTLYSFCSKRAREVCTDGELPSAGLVQATDGNLYGTTLYGGNRSGRGTVFAITPAGSLTTLHRFCLQSDCADGSLPHAGLVQATNGDFYGTTEYGGAFCEDPGCGTVFGLSVGLGPFVETRPTSGNVGAIVKILGTDLTGASGVTFNGVPAVFGFSSPSQVTEITTTVPAGATTGTVQVVTPSGTLSSNVPFRVLP